MTGNDLKPGDTFLVNLGNETHLHVVLSYPFDKDKLIVVTMISTYDEDDKDATCLLRPEDGHPFIKHFSYVAYRMAMKISIEDIQKLKAKPMPSFSAEVTKRIIKGADVSKFFPNEYWIILDNQKLFNE